MRRVVALGALSLMLAGCAAPKPAVPVTFAVRSGGTASVQGIPPERSVMALEFLTPLIGYVAVAETTWCNDGSCPALRSVLMSTGDGGLSWTAQSLPQGGALDIYGIPDRAISFVSPERGFLDTNSGLYATGDGGSNWRIVP